MLLQEDAWLVGRLIYRDTGEVSGTVMLQFADGLDTLVSFFQPHGSSGWVQAMATRAGKAQILHRQGPRPLPKSLVQGSLSGIYSSYPEPSQEDLGWSPILRDCVLHSLKARVAYLEEAISSQRSEAAVTLRGCRCAERGGWYDTSVSAQSLKAKTLARTIWSQVDAACLRSSRQHRPRKESEAKAGLAREIKQFSAWRNSCRLQHHPRPSLRRQCQGCQGQRLQSPQRCWWSPRMGHANAACRLSAMFTCKLSLKGRIDAA